MNLLSHKYLGLLMNEKGGLNMTKLLDSFNNNVCVFIDDEEYNLLINEYNEIIENIEE